MTDFIRVDAHVHLYRSTEEGQTEKAGYEVWEYGEQAEVHQTDCVGTLDELLVQMEATGISKAVIVNLFSAKVNRQLAIDALPYGLTEAETRQRLRDIDVRIIDELIAFNRWNCDIAQKHPGLAPFIAADVNAFESSVCAQHVRDMVEDYGAAGVKLHGAFQGFDMSDERLWPVYETCQELAIPIIAHSGPDHDHKGFAEPRAFANMLKAFPHLRMVVAHLGGAAWKQTLEIAQTFPNAYFDCCEIIEWTNSTHGPTDEQLAQMIIDIGPERVMMGSDFPWYDLDHSIDRVFSLPLLSQEQKERIIGANAVDILGL